jgi:uncharacterized membrane protein YeaQ/YmgE (transglycosylase-associated protein family)
MLEIYNLLIGIGILILGFFIGNFLAKKTKEELKAGQKWFKIIIILGLVGAVAGLILGNDFLLFSFSFIALVTSRSIKK